MPSYEEGKGIYPVEVLKNMVQPYFVNGIVVEGKLCNIGMKICTQFNFNIVLFERIVNVDVSIESPLSRPSATARPDSGGSPDPFSEYEAINM